MGDLDKNPPTPLFQGKLDSAILMGCFQIKDGYNFINQFLKFIGCDSPFPKRVRGIYHRIHLFNNSPILIS